MCRWTEIDVDLGDQLENWIDKLGRELWMDCTAGRHRSNKCHSICLPDRPSGASASSSEESITLSLHNSNSENKATDSETDYNMLSEGAVLGLPLFILVRLTLK